MHKIFRYFAGNGKVWLETHSRISFSPVLLELLERWILVSGKGIGQKGRNIQPYYTAVYLSPI